MQARFIDAGVSSSELNTGSGYGVLYQWTIVEADSGERVSSRQAPVVNINDLVLASN